MDDRDGVGAGDGMRRLTFVSVALILSTGLWTAQLAVGAGDHSGVAVVLIAVSLWAATVVSLTGMLVARARWARRFGLAVTAGHGVVAVITSPGILWGVALAASAITAVSVAGPWLDGIVRGRPSASGPPSRVVLIALFLLGVPFGLGATGAAELPALVVGLSALAACFWFVRALPGALFVVRIVWPLLAVGLAYPMGYAAAAVAVFAGIAVGTLAWHPTVRNSLHPLVESGSRVPIPPELAPRDVLDAAEIDDRGRPL